MQREIKFRVWDSYGLWSFVGVDFWSLPRNIVNLTEDQEAYTIQQFTGLNLNGKDIYEGDILRLDSGKPYQSDYEVVYGFPNFYLIHAKRESDDYGVYTRQFGNINMFKPKLIGNIFKNPELSIPVRA